MSKVHNVLLSPGEVSLVFSYTESGQMRVEMVTGEDAHELAQVILVLVQWATQQLREQGVLAPSGDVIPWPIVGSDDTTVH